MNTKLVKLLTSPLVEDFEIGLALMKSMQFSDLNKEEFDYNPEYTDKDIRVSGLPRFYPIRAYIKVNKDTLIYRSVESLVIRHIDSPSVSKNIKIYESYSEARSY